MPFVEFIFSTVGIIIIVILGGVLLAFYAAVFSSIVIFSAVTGWIPILVCATDQDYAIGFQYGFVGGWAAISTMIYMACSVSVIILSFIKPDPDGLPPAWKFLSMFYTYRPAATAKVSIDTDTRSWNMSRFSDGIEKGAPSWGHHKATSGLQMRKQTARARREAKRMKEENDKRAAEINDAGALADAMLDLEREKARREGFGGDSKK